MKLRNFIMFLSIFFVSILNAMECEDGANVFGLFKPPFIPVEITIDRNGIEVETTAEILTPYGTFGLGYSKDFSSMDNDCYYIVINNTSTKEKTVYAINKGERLKYNSKSLKGIRHFIATTNMMEFDVNSNDRFVIKIDENKIEKFVINYYDGDLNIGKGKDIVSIPIDDISDFYKKVILGKLAMVNPLVAGIMYFSREASSDDLDNNRYVNKIQLQLLASTNENQVIKELEKIRSKGIDNVYYLKMKNGYYKVFIDSNDKSKFRRLLPQYSDSFLVRIED